MQKTETRKLFGKVITRVEKSWVGCVVTHLDAAWGTTRAPSAASMPNPGKQRALTIEVTPRRLGSGASSASSSRLDEVAASHAGKGRQERERWLVEWDVHSRCTRAKRAADTALQALVDGPLAAAVAPGAPERSRAERAALTQLQQLCSLFLRIDAEGATLEQELSVPQLLRSAQALRIPLAGPRARPSPSPRFSPPRSLPPLDPSVSPRRRPLRHSR